MNYVFNSDDEILINKYKGFIIASINRYCNLQDFYEDLYQEGCIILLQCIKTFNPDITSFDAYLSSSLKYHFINTFHYLVDNNHISIDYNNIDKYLYSDYDIEDDYIKKETIGEIFTAILELSEKEIQILHMTYRQDLTTKEICEKLNITPKTVYNTRCNALKKLREILRNDKNDD